MFDFFGHNEVFIQCDITLRFFSDAEEILRNLVGTERVVVVGGGILGLDIAEAICKLEKDVVLIAREGRLGVPMLSEKEAKERESKFKKMGGEIIYNEEVTEIKGGTEIESVLTKGGKNITAQMVLVAIGIRPNSELAEAAGLELSVDRSISVDRRLRTSDGSIFSAGDCADAFHVVTGMKTCIPLALRANRAGWAVADNVCGKKTALPGVAGTAVFRTSRSST